jgi:hypothetical protein
VKWKKLHCQQRGELGILDPQIFSRALHLRWLWFEWTKTDRHLFITTPPCDEIYKQIFRASTTVTIGNGNKQKFWQCSWQQGRSPRDMQLYKLARWKEDITEHNWTRDQWRMSTAEEMA